MGIETIDEVLIANAEFYSCFETQSMDRMSEVWEHSDQIRCTHPGWPTLKGWGAVSGSFYNLFQSQIALRFLLTETDVRIEEDLAMVFCTENIIVEGASPSVSSLNIFRRETGGGKWSLIVHHAAIVSDQFG